MSTPRKQPFSLFRSKIVLVVGGAGLVFVGMAIVDEVQRRAAVQREIHTMEQEIERLGQQRERLTNLLHQVDSPEFLEREARLRLGLKKPGETVLIVPEGLSIAEGGVPNEPEQESNFRKWWQHVFK